MAAEQATGRVVELHRPGLRERTNCEQERDTGLADVVVRGLATSGHQADLSDLGAVDAAAGAGDAVAPPAAQVGPRQLRGSDRLWGAKTQICG
jgi:hypothetical protein